MRIGFIGLGLMGKPIAINLIKAGHDVTVVNRSQGKVRELVDMGATAGTSPADAAADAEVVALCLSGEETVEEVLSGEDGVLAGAKPGTVVLDHSTVHPEFAKRMEALCAAKDAVYLDAPVSGTGQVAWDGRLTIMVGGDANAFERAKPSLEAVSAHAFHLGPVGSGNIAKLINNMIGDVNQIAVMEAFVLATKLGLDVAALFEVLLTASASSRQMTRIAPKLLSDDPEKTSRLGGHLKGQERMRWLSEQAGVRLPMREAAEAFWRRGVEAGLADADPIAGAKLIEGA
jgi:3-hydroxyisobutyrate dehydrogenase-like beta-hydroxyacid dehydrogenase